MKLIVGLGNPGRIYAGLRHNIGSSVAKALAKRYKIALRREFRVPALSAKVRVDNLDFILAVPLVYMNLSGSAVSGLVKKHRIDLGDLLVVCDDLDLEFGRLRIRPAGSSGGHRGLQSAIQALGAKDFCRLRVGIGRPEREDKDAADYVLSQFTRREAKQVPEVICRACDCLELWIKAGVTKAMNIFNPQV
jgi:PTH1 family peptidyl-tRNA hydrolase